jgi:prefoldin beta subunit
VKKVSISKEDQDDIIKFQQTQQQIQILLMQKQNIQMQGAEIEGAMKELEKAKEKDAFEVIGNIMVKKPKKEIMDSLKEKKELMDLRMSTIDKQAEKLNEKAVELQKKLASNIKQEKKK